MGIHEERFDIDGDVTVDVSTSTGDILVSAGEPGCVVIGIDADVVQHFDIAQRGDVVIAHLRRGIWRTGGSTDVRVRTAPGSRLQVSTAAGDVSVTIDLGGAEISTASGDVRLRDVSGPVAVKTASGDVYAQALGDRTEVITASGDVQVVSTTGPATFTTASGDVRIDVATDTLGLRSASGDFDVRSFDGRSLAVKSMAGDLRVGIRPRRRLQVSFNSIAGNLDNRLPEGDDSPPERIIDLDAKTVSGDVTLVGA